MKPSELITKGWCQRVSARDKKNNYCLPGGQKATQWCLLGAVFAVHYHSIADYNDVLTYVKNKLGVAKISSIMEWNDDHKRTKQEVIDLLVSIGE